MTEIIPCLLRIGDNVKKYRIFKLDRNQITIGRSGDVTYAILSNMISRCHAFIKSKDYKIWEITDNKSLNGVYINGRQLTPFAPYTLQEGDMVQFGVPTTPEMPAEFVYKFYSSLKVRIEKKNKKLKAEDSTDSEQRKDTFEVNESDDSEAHRDSKRKKPTCCNDRVGSPNNVMRESMETSQKEQAAKEAEYQAKLAEMEKILKEREEREQKFQEQLERERQEKENHAKEVEELRLKVLSEMKDKKDLENEREELKKKMQEEMEQNLKEREAALKTQLLAQKDTLLNEKKQVEERLQREMEKALEEKNKELEQQLLDQKNNLDKILEKKDMEQKVLECQLNETKEESATAKILALKAREEVLSNFVDLMEMELQCAICNELFIKATSLNCSHVFCKLCIAQWCKVKKECPNCRKPVTTQMQALALDNYIDKMVEQLSDDLKQRRKELLESRKAEQDKFDAVALKPQPVIAVQTTALALPTPSTSGAVRRGARTRRGRGANNRSNRGGQGQGQSRATAIVIPALIPVTSATTSGVAASTRPSTTASGTTTTTSSTTTSTATGDSSAAASDIDPVIELSSDASNNNSSEDSDSDGSVPGDPDAYYGGYGRCYNCGSRGHWANGCPE